MNDAAPPSVPGADQVVSWFGHWPSFHDAEVIRLDLNRRGVSRLVLHAWLMTDKTYEADGQQYFVRDKHAVVTFELKDISDLELSDFSQQNVLACLDVMGDSSGVHIQLYPSYGIGGRIDAGQVTVSVTPGMPE